MGLFNIFEKKSCSVCGGEIGLLGNRKLEDGNLCKNCAAKLSPWFSDRRSSTVEQIKAQLQYREENKSAVAAFHTTRSLGNDSTRLLLDEDARKFMITRARNLAEANPDVLDFSMVTDARLNIEEDRDEVKKEDAEGKSVSYDPPRYDYSYDFKIVIRVNHPYFDELSFKLNPSPVQTTQMPVTEIRKPNPKLIPDYAEYERLGNEAVDLLLNSRRPAQSAPEAAPAFTQAPAFTPAPAPAFTPAPAAPAGPMTCPACGATTTPDANGCCEFCGSKVL